ncbi:MAG: beta-lactamase family protein [Promicromonosporaceae bacterium]|nr:beta-lactamase family protein [Promicromonosporaceae bacterium]
MWQLFPDNAMDLGNILIEFLNVVQREKLPIHSIAIAKGEQTLLEAYYAPIGPDSLQRMFSITKSFTAAAILLLIVDRQVQLTDPIINYFPEYAPVSPHPWLSALTIGDLLTMRTQHRVTPYKSNPERDWVENFLATEPTQPPGQLFGYDTGASHVLGALVEKLTGKSILNFLRDSGLSDFGFSTEAYIIADPHGIPLGGSGLMAKTGDLIAFGRYLLAARGEFRELLNEATQIQASVPFSGIQEINGTGYGYHFWTVPNGYLAHGMGGQFLLVRPNSGVIVAITADTQGYAGADGRLLYLLLTSVVPALEATALPWAPSPALQERLRSLSFTRRTSASAPPIGWRTCAFALDENEFGLTNLALSLSDDDGELTFTANGETQSVPFGINSLRVGTSPVLGQLMYSSGIWQPDGTLFITSQLLGESKGTLHFYLAFNSGKVLMRTTKIVESQYPQFDNQVYHGYE